MIPHVQGTALAHRRHNAPPNDLASRVAATHAREPHPFNVGLHACCQLCTDSRGMHYPSVLLVVKTSRVPNLTTRVVGHRTKCFIVVHGADVAFASRHWFCSRGCCGSVEEHRVDGHVVCLRQTVGFVAHPNHREQLTWQQQRSIEFVSGVWGPNIRANYCVSRARYQYRPSIASVIPPLRAAAVWLRTQ